MIPKIEHIGQASSSRRVRRFLSELFGSKYEQFLEREIVQQRIEKDRTISELRADRDRLLEALMAVKGIPLRVPVPQVVTGTNAPPLPTKWQQIVAAEQQKIAREEEQEQVKEN